MLSFIIFIGLRHIKVTKEPSRVFSSKKRSHPSLPERVFLVNSITSTVYTVRGGKYVEMNDVVLQGYSKISSLTILLQKKRDIGSD